MDTDYDQQFYDTITDGSVRSANAVAGFYYYLLGEPQTVVDIGCGRGVWGKQFETLGCEVLGVDGGYVYDPVIPFMAHDLRNPLVLDKKYDLALCLEVAEHLPEESADTLIDSLCNASDKVLFSAAIPYQTGHGHINCQWPSYWAEKFRQRGYAWGDYRSDFWHNENVEPWYRQNMLLFVKTESTAVYVPPMDLVHPVIHSWGR